MLVRLFPQYCCVTNYPQNQWLIASENSHSLLCRSTTVCLVEVDLGQAAVPQTAHGLAPYYGLGSGMVPSCLSWAERVTATWGSSFPGGLLEHKSKVNGTRTIKASVHIMSAGIPFAKSKCVTNRTGNFASVTVGEDRVKSAEWKPELSQMVEERSWENLRHVCELSWPDLWMHWTQVTTVPPAMPTLSGTSAWRLPGMGAHCLPRQHFRAIPQITKADLNLSPDQFITPPQALTLPPCDA